MTPQSAKAKGRRLQQWLVKKIKERWTSLAEGDDVMSRAMGSQGTDVILSQRARQFVGPISFECKNTETWAKLYNAYEQASYNTRKNDIPIVVLKSNGKIPLAALDAEFLLELLDAWAGNKLEDAFFSTSNEAWPVYDVDGEKVMNIASDEDEPNDEL
jgi:hypothetical protein